MSTGNDRIDRLLRFAREATAETTGDLPAFPAVATRLVDLLEQPGASLEDVEQLIAQDQAISSQVLRTANSVLYVGAMPASDVSTAVMRLGFSESANIAMLVACRTLFDMEDRAELELFAECRRARWHASLVGAYGARLVSRELGVGDPERAFLGGMFRHVGSLLALRALARGRMAGRLDLDPSSEELEETLAVIGPELGERYLRECGMPEAVIEIAKSGRCRSEAAKPVLPEVAILALCEVLSADADEVSCPPFDRESADVRVESLGLDDDKLEYFGLQIAELAEQVKALL